MIESYLEYLCLLKRLRHLKKQNKLSRHLESKLEGMEKCELLINKQQWQKREIQD